MKRILTAILMIVLLGLSACAVPTAEDAAPSPTPDDEIRDNDHIEPAPSPFPGNALTGPIQTYAVTDNDQIIDVLTEAIISRKILVHFDMHAFDKPVSNYYPGLTSNFYSILWQNPDLEYAEHVRCNYDAARQLLTTEIEYMYFICNQDILCVPDKPDLYVVLDKKVIKEGETTCVTLTGKDTDKYSLQVIPSDPSILEVGEGNSVTALKEDEAYLDITVKGKEFDQSYPHAFHISALPQDVPEVYDIAGLTAAAWQGLGKPSQPIFIINDKIKIEDMEKVLWRVGGGYIRCKLGKNPICIYNFSKSNIPLAQRVEAEQKADEIIAAVIRPGMSELEKETAIYDYLIQNTQYDYRVYDDPDHFPFESGTAYGPIVNGMGICAGYSYALQMLLNKTGIECMTVEGTAGEPHMWNIAKIDGVYYQMDATFDSCYSYNDNRVSHDYFNLSDAQMGLDHEWSTSIYPPCPDTLSE